MGKGAVGRSMKDASGEKGQRTEMRAAAGRGQNNVRILKQLRSSSGQRSRPRGWSLW